MGIYLTEHEFYNEILPWILFLIALVVHYICLKILWNRRQLILHYIGWFATCFYDALITFIADISNAVRGKRIVRHDPRVLSGTILPPNPIRKHTNQ